MKQASEIDNALRRLAKQRDKLLRDAPALAPKREAQLSDFLAAEFPIEAALRARATERDRSLDSPLEIPPSVELTLRRQLAAVVSKRPVEVVGGWRFFRSPQSIVLSACVLIGTAIFWFADWGTSSGRIPVNRSSISRTDGMSIRSALDSSPIADVDLFSRKISIRPFSLRTNEAASLQASFFANTEPNFADVRMPLLDLRLELPMKANLTEDDLARTP